MSGSGPLELDGATLQRQAGESAFFFFNFLNLSIVAFTVFQVYSKVFVQLLNHVQLFATPWITACQASLSFTISWNLLKLMSTESVMPSSLLILCRPLLLLPSIFSNESTLRMSGQSTGVSALASFLPKKSQG